MRNILAARSAGRHPASLLATDEIVSRARSRALRRSGARRAPGPLPVRGRRRQRHGGRSASRHRPDRRAGRPADAHARPRRRQTTLRLPPRRRGAIAAAQAFLALAAASGERPVAHRASSRAAPRRWRARLGARLRPGRLALSPGAPSAAAVQNDGRAAVTALPPLGRLDPALLGALSRSSRARTRGAALERADADAAGRRPSRGQGAARRPREPGFAVSEDSGWRGLSACAGPRRVLERPARRARRRRPPRGRPHGDAPREHWSGCERRCGRPPDVHVAVTALS